MKRRQPAAPPVATYAVPPELAIGPCVEVWAADGRDRMDAYLRHRDARHKWEGESGVATLSMRERCRLLPYGGTWSARGPGPGPMSDELLDGWPEYVAEKLLARAGVTVDDIPRLHSAAQRWGRA